LVKKADFCGIYTGKKVDKFEKCGFNKQEGSVVSCPIIAECPLTLECKVKEIVPLGTHDMFISEIVAVDVAEELLDENGKLHLERARLAAFAHGEYFEVGKKIGTFGFSVKSKKGKGQKAKK
jgi:flavin reductase (DIM6/NTAB) family NADH-FMN oxidoreductase RutF